MKLSDFDAFILDLDGTLIDSGKYHARAFADAVLAQSGYRLAPQEHHEFFASHSTVFAAVLNRRHGLALDPARVLPHKRARLQEIFVAEPFAGAREFLERWHGRMPMALATNSPRCFVEPALAAADLLRFFESVATCDDVRQRKPDPELVEKTIRDLAVDPAKALVFEDQLIGIEAARAAGAAVVAVDNGQPVSFPPGVPVLSWQGLLERSGPR